MSSNRALHSHPLWRGSGLPAIACQIAFLLASSATAQEAEQPAPVPATATSASEVEATEPEATEPEAPSDPDAPETSVARTVVARAKALFAVGDYGAALTEFMRARELLAGDPRGAAVLNNIAVCHERLFRYDLALEYYERYLREASTSPEDRAEVEAVMHSLRDVLGTLHVTGNVRGEIWVDDHKLGQVPVDLLVPAGAHVIEVRAKGHESARRELRVTARAEQRLHFELDPLPNYRGLHPAYFWTGTALTAAALITGAAFGVAALSKSSDGDAMAARGLISDRQPVRDVALKADIAFGTALVLGVGTTVLFFLTDWHGPTTERAPQPKPPALSLGLGATRTSLALAVTGAVP